MHNEQISELIRQQLPILIEHDKALQDIVFRLAREHFAPRQETKDDIRMLIDELRRDREAQTLKWEQQDHKWKDQNHKWEENQRHLDQLYHEVKAVAEKHDRSIGALGARWGMRTERSFRNALVAILERSFGVEVLNVTEYDDDGQVFGRPDQIDLDVIINNGTLILCEIKSSVSKPDIYIFERKVRFYERRHGRKADRMLVISPMIAPNALKVAEKLGIETYTDSEDVPVE